jgi:hypothetical protein
MLYVEPVRNVATGHATWSLRGRARFKLKDEWGHWSDSSVEV